LRQHKFLSHLQNKIETDEGWSSINDDLNDVKKFLSNPDSIKMHVSADLDVLCEIQSDIPSIMEQLIPSNLKRSKNQ